MCPPCTRPPPCATVGPMRSVKHVGVTSVLVVASQVVATMPAAAATASAAAVGPAAATTASAETPKDRARALFEEARTAFNLADYDTAINALTEAFKIARDIEDERERNSILSVLQLNLANAHSEAFSIDRDIQHLRIAQNLLRKQLAQDLSEQQRAEATALSETVNAQYEAAQSDAATPDEETAATDPEDDNEPSPAPAPPNETADRDRKMAPLTLGGIVTLAAAGASFGAMGAGFAIAGQAQKDYDAGTTGSALDAAVQRGKTGNILTVVGGAAGVALAATGAALLVIGKKKGNRNVAVMPLIGTDSAMVSLGGHF